MGILIHMCIHNAIVMSLRFQEKRAKYQFAHNRFVTIAHVITLSRYEYSGRTRYLSCEVLDYVTPHFFDIHL